MKRYFIFLVGKHHDKNERPSTGNDRWKLMLVSKIGCEMPCYCEGSYIPHARITKLTDLNMKMPSPYFEQWRCIVYMYAKGGQNCYIREKPHDEEDTRRVVQQFKQCRRHQRSFEALKSQPPVWISMTDEYVVPCRMLQSQEAHRSRVVELKRNWPGVSSFATFHLRWCSPSSTSQLSLQPFNNSHCDAVARIRCIHESLRPTSPTLQLNYRLNIPRAEERPPRLVGQREVSQLWYKEPDSEGRARHPLASVTLKHSDLSCGPDDVLSIISSYGWEWSPGLKAVHTVAGLAIYSNWTTTYLPFISTLWYLGRDSLCNEHHRIRHQAFFPFSQRRTQNDENGARHAVWKESHQWER